MTDTATTTHPGLTLVGTKVLAWTHDEPIVYAGEDPHGFASVNFGFGKETTINVAPTYVAPADTPLADAKDPRIAVEKGTTREARDAGHYGRGSWKLRLDGSYRTAWANTKAEAVAMGQRRLAILDWQAAQTA